MRLCAYVGLVALLATGGIACGGAKPAQEVTPSQAAQPAQKEAPAGVADVARGFEAMAKGAKEMEELSKLPPVEPVSFKEFEPLFPGFAGWEKGTPEGEKMAAPIAVSQSQLAYTKGDSRIEAKIVDSGNSRMFIAPFLVYLNAGYEKQTANGYEKSIKFAEYAAWEQWDGTEKNGELNILVNKRFLVTLSGTSIENTKVLHELAGKFDLGKLGALK
jgi:hypothetical protein